MQHGHWIALLLVGAVASACGGTVDGGGSEPDVTALDDGTLASVTTPSGCPPLLSIAAVNMQVKTMGANQGGIWNLWSNGYLEQSVTFPTTGAYQIAVEASGNVVRGVGAQMEVRIDQQRIGGVEANSGTWAVYNFTVNISAGTHKIEIAFMNDAAYSRTEDRNLLVKSVAVAAASCSTSTGGDTTTCSTIATLAAINMTTKTMGADQGGFWNIWSNGYIEQGVTFPTSGAYEVDVLASSSVVRNVGAIMELRIDQKVVGTIEVRAVAWTSYPFAVNVSAGAHKVAVAFTNDAFYSALEDRNLLVKTVTVARTSCSDQPPSTDPPTTTNPPTTTAPSDQLAAAIAYNTVGENDVYPLGVPESYSWYAGAGGTSHTELSPAGFTAMTGWGVIYPQRFASGNTNPDARIQLRNLKVYLHHPGGGWTLVQQQGADNIHGAFFVADFAGNQGISWVQQNLAGNVTQLGVPPVGYNAHYWPDPRGELASQSADGVFMRVDARTTDPATNVVMQLGADWWRDQNAPYVDDFSNNPGIGGTNWRRIETTWQSYHLYTLDKDDFLADLPPFD